MSDSLRNKTSFYYPMLLLPPERRKALEWLYRFCREADDIADEPASTASKRRRLARLRGELRKGWNGTSGDLLISPFLKAARPLGITLEPLETILRGVESDMGSPRLRTFKALKDYALKVAGAPGISSMEIFGFHDDAHRRYALNLGLFLQLTNVVRDLVEDRSLHRLYLPEEDWKRFNLSPRDLPQPGVDWDSFVRFQLDRALSFWNKACSDLDRADRGFLATAEAMAAVYLKLWRRLYYKPSRILKGRVSLSKTEKLSAVLSASLRCLYWKGLLTP